MAILCPRGSKTVCGRKRWGESRPSFNGPRCSSWGWGRSWGLHKSAKAALRWGRERGGSGSGSFYSFFPRRCRAGRCQGRPGLLLCRPGIRIQIDEEEDAAVREARSGQKEGEIDPLFGDECAALIRLTTKPFARLPRVLQRRVVAAALQIRLGEAEAVVGRDAERLKVAERWVVTEAERAHNAEQPLVLLPDVLQGKIIDFLPSGR